MTTPEHERRDPTPAGATPGADSPPTAAPGADSQPTAAPGTDSPPTAPPPGYVWAYPPPPPPERLPWRAPRWLKITTALWVLLLAAVGTWYALHGHPSVREQTTVGQARPVVDRAIVDVVDAAGGGPVVAVSGFDRVGSCAITAVRSGARYHRVADFYTSPGTESAVLHAIASGMPSRYHADTTSGAKPALYADAGDYVAVRGSVTAPGVVEVSADTGCRQASGTTVARPAVAPGSPEATTIAHVVDALSVAVLGRPTGPAAAVPIATVASLACSSAGTLRTAAATLPPGSAPASLGAVLAGLAPTPAAKNATTYAFRAGVVDVVAKSDASRAVTVTATTRCSAP